MPDQASDQMSGGMTTDASPLALPESNIAESVDEDSFVEQPLALLLPCYHGCFQTLNLRQKPKRAKLSRRQIMMISVLVRLMTDLPAPLQ